MTDRDAFEARFGAAVHAYVGRLSSDLDPFEFAHRIAGDEPRRRRPIALGWRGVGMPRLAWILLLLAALLAAMVGGALIVGSQRDGRLPAVVPPVGQAAVCPPGSTPDEPGPVDQARPPQDSAAAVAFDRRAGRLIALMSVVDGPRTWTFDVCTNTWTQQRPDQEPIGRVDEWSLLVYDVDSDVTIAMDRLDGTVWAYDLRADTWTRKGNGPAGVQLGAYDPVSGLVLATDNTDPIGLWTYDVATDVWTPLRMPGGAPTGVSAGALAYDASVDRMVVYAGGLSDTSETWLLDIRTGTWSRSDAEIPQVVGWWTAPTMAYDEAARRTAVFMRIPLTAYDATADRWEILAEGDGAWPYPSRMAYDPLNHRLVGMSEWRGTPDIDIPPGGVEALELETGERTVLLEPAGE